MGWRQRKSVCKLYIVVIRAGDVGGVLVRLTLCSCELQMAVLIWARLKFSSYGLKMSANFSHELQYQPTRLHDVTTKTTLLSKEVIYCDMCSGFWSKFRISWLVFFTDFHNFCGQMWTLSPKLATSTFFQIFSIHHLLQTERYWKCR
jgi:hypothetical protein